MRNPLIAMVVFVLLGPGPVPAQELLVDAHAMFYYRVAFDGGDASDREAAFGFRMDQVVYQPGRPLQYNRLLQRPALLGLSLNRHGLQSLQFTGTDYLRRYRVQRADEEDGGAGEESEDVPQAPKPIRDVGNTVSYLLEEAPGGFIIGAVLGVGLLVGAGD